MSAPISVLLVEDDARLAQFTAEYFAEHGLAVTLASEGERGLAEALARPFDVVVLDLMLPKRDGLSVCRALRAKTDVPIIMVTARGEEADRVLGLELGADDYVVKPFSARELLARVRAVVRRDRREAGPGRLLLRAGRLCLYGASRRATLDGRELSLTSSEFDLLAVLAEHRGRALSREQLLDLVKGSAEEAFDRSIDVHVSRLRQKLGDDGRRPSIIKTLRGLGYMLVDDEGGA
ncbi:MAG TPA: response regulator transcription factor [Polyangiaceae bacterium]|nr:response regulator transcription factor [Polyangiaceae bacterium]